MRIPRTLEYIKTNPRFALTRASRPRLQQGQMTIVYESLEPYPTEYSLEELAARCIERGYRATIRRPNNAANLTFIRKSILYHLDRLLNGTTYTERDLIRIVPDK
jgi:hypothetical protein